MYNNRNHTEYVPSPYGIKPEITNRKLHGTFPNIWKLNNIVLNKKQNKQQTFLKVYSQTQDRNAKEGEY